MKKSFTTAITVRVVELHTRYSLWSLTDERLAKKFSVSGCFVNLTDTILQELFPNQQTVFLRVSIKPLTGKRVIVLTRLGFNRFKLSNAWSVGHEVFLCKKDLVMLFGKNPHKLYVKEVKL